jgi:carbon storage regulator CsrA
MLVLSRRPHEKILFPGFDTAVEVVAIKPGVVRLGIQAPPGVTVLREELAAKAGGSTAAGPRPAEAPADPRLADLRRLIDTRLGITAKGLAVLRGQLVAGPNPDALLTLDELEDELRMLRERVRDEAAATPRRPAKTSAPKRKALLVEDNPQERDLMAQCLRLEGLEVDTAGDGCDALDYLRARGRPDVVLLDMGLPRLDGPATVRAIRRDPAWAGLKVFAVSGYAADDYNLVGPGGVNGWFQKPVDPAELVRDLARELGVAAGVP